MHEGHDVHLTDERRVVQYTPHVVAVRIVRRARRAHGEIQERLQAVAELDVALLPDTTISGHAGETGNLSEIAIAVAETWFTERYR